MVTGGLLSNFHLARALAPLSTVRVLTLSSTRRPPDGTTAFPHDVLTRAVPAWPRGMAYLAWRAFLRSALLDAVARWGTPDVVVATTAMMPLLAHPALRGSRTVALVRAYENFGWRVPGGTVADRWQGIRLEATRGFSSRRLIGLADLVIVNSRYMAGAVARRFAPRRVEVLYPCIDLVEPRCDDSRRFETGGADGAPPACVGFVHRRPGKNLAFVEAVAGLMPDVAFLVFGPPPPRPASRPNVLFQGWDNDRIRMFGSAPVWIVPSRWEEPFGRVAAEARALGRRVIVSARGGLGEAAGEDGVIVPSLEPDAWVGAIRAALSRPHRPDEQARIGARLRAVFGQDPHDRQVRSIMSSLLAGA